LIEKTPFYGESLMKGRGIPTLINKSLALCFLIAWVTLTACGNSTASGGAEGDPAALPTQSEGDVILDPEVLARSATNFDPSITDGGTLFITYCAKCHGQAGLGDGPSVGSLSSQAGMNLTILQDRSDEELFTIISGGKGVEMPPWGLVLTVEQRQALLEHVRSLANQ